MYYLLDKNSKIVYNVRGHRKETKTMLTQLSAARLVEMLQNAAAAQGVSLEDCSVWIRANHRENEYDSEEQVEVSCDENGFMTINLLEDLS
jgi:hypothetical protein